MLSLKSNNNKATTKEVSLRDRAGAVTKVVNLSAAQMLRRVSDTNVSKLKPSTAGSYWKSQSPRTTLNDILFLLCIPDCGQSEYEFAEPYRKASKLYYDMYNNGGGNIIDCYEDYVEAVVIWAEKNKDTLSASAKRVVKWLSEMPSRDAYYTNYGQYGYDDETDESASDDGTSSSRWVEEGYNSFVDGGTSTGFDQLTDSLVDYVRAELLKAKNVKPRATTSSN